MTVHCGRILRRSWDGTTLAAVRTLLMDPESDEAKHFVPAQKELLRQAEKLAGLPANLRTGVPAGPWSPTQKALTPQCKRHLFEHQGW